jgi:hypothetical protein
MRWLKSMHVVSSSAGVSAGGRDARLDMFRGVALVMIFINHVPGTIYESITSRNFGFSDAAEAFVFMSGLAAGLAYSNGFRAGNAWLAIAKVWSRARQLYFIHLVITMISLGFFAAAALWLDLPQVLQTNNIQPLFSQPLSTLVGIPLLTHQFGYLNILPIYAVLLVVTPGLIALGLRWPRAVFFGSLVLWILAGQFRLNFPNYPLSGGWFFNPFSWQVLFVAGLMSGIAMKTGNSFIPYNRVLFVIAAAFLIFVLFWMKVPPVGQWGQSVMSAMRGAGVPFYITNFDKTFLSLPRLLHALALFYVFGNWRVMAGLAQTAFAKPFRLLGQQGLAVFATGTVISLVFQIIKIGAKSWLPEGTSTLPLDTVLMILGLGALLALAWSLRETTAMRKRAAKRP